MLEGRWKLVLLFHLFGGKTLRFSELERVTPGVSQKMLAVSASAIGSCRCNGVRWASWVLW